MLFERRTEMRKNVIRMLVVLAMIFMLSAVTTAEAAPVSSGICLCSARKPKPERVYISKTSITLKVGSRPYKLKAWTSNSKRVKGRWYSSRRDVASVDSSGRVITKRPGVAWITVVIHGRSQSCKVIVKR